METVRLIIDEGDGFYNMAMDETLLYLRALGKSPSTLRLYVFTPSTISIGYFQSLADSVNMEQAKRLKVPIVRRISGGGSVYHDSDGEITYSIVTSLDEIPSDYVDSFRYLSAGIIEAAKSLGLPAEFKPLNDGVVYGKKFSGNARARKLGAVLQHGTFMYATDLRILSSLLKAPKEKMAGKSIKTIYDRVTTLSIALGKRITRSEALKALIDGFRKALNVELERGTYTKEELVLANSLKWKYISSEWTRLRP
jgi:lipoate-protein ligase A